jgi:hypothetical protein
MADHGAGTRRRDGRGEKPVKPAAAPPPAPLRILYIGAGLACIVLGAIGLLLPVMPSTVFFILAAGALARGSPTLEAWLLNQRHIGPAIVAWRTRGAIPRRAKVLATGGIALGLTAVLLLPAGWPVALLSAAVAAAALAFIWTRPA